MCGFSFASLPFRIHVLDCFIHPGAPCIVKFPKGLKQLKPVPEPDLLNVTVYPNPFPGEIRITFLEKISDKLFVSVCDLNGKGLYFNSFPASQEINLDLGSLRPSLYIIKVYTEKKYYISKLIRE